MQERGQSLKSREWARFPLCGLRRNLRRGPRLLSLLLRLRLRVVPRRQLNARTLRVRWPGALRLLHAESGGFWASVVSSCLGLADSCCGVSGYSLTRARSRSKLDKDRRLRPRFLRTSFSG